MLAEMRSWHRLALAGVIRQPVMDSTGALQGPLAANSLRTADDRLDKGVDRDHLVDQSDDQRWQRTNIRPFGGFSSVGRTL